MVLLTSIITLSRLKRYNVYVEVRVSGQIAHGMVALMDNIILNL
jgi:hypothetical protein